MRVSTSLSVLCAVLAAALLCFGCDNDVGQERPENINISVDADGNIYWNDELVTCEEFETRLSTQLPGSSPVPSICHEIEAPYPER
jgi:hypothetical protein